jgi:hypothetical protein
MLGLKADVFRHACLAQPVAIVQPFLWQVQAIRHRQARMAVGKRQRYGDLAVIFLAKLAAILPGNANRVPPLPATPSRGPWLELSRPTSALRRQNAATIDAAPPPRRCRHRRHRLYALAFTRHHQTQAIVPQRPRPVRMSDHAHKSLDIGRKPRFTVICSSTIHLSPLMPA